MTILDRSSDISKLNFHDLFDLETIQNIQDAFAMATGVASIITDTNGVPITQPSNFCDLCRNVIRKTEKGLANCYRSNAILGQVNTEGPTIQPCLSGGLLDGGTSIMAGDQHVANWLIGQVLDESCDIEAMKTYAREIGADEELYHQSLDKVTHMPREKFEQIARMLFLIANQLSEQALLNVTLAKNIAVRTQVEKELQVQILEHETSQRLLKESEERFKALHDASFGGVIIHDKGTILDCNQSLSEITGFTNEELIGMDGLKLIAPDSLDLVLKNMQSGYELQYEVEGLRKDGSVYPLAIRGKNIQYKGREVRVVEFRDISERMEAERALRESEERFRQVAMTNWVWETNLEGRYTYCSDNVMDTLGYTAEEIIGRTPSDFMSQQEARRVGEIFAEIVAGRNRIIDLENWNITKNGSEICLLTNGAPFYDKTGNLIGYRGGDKDITDRKQAEERLRKSEAHLLSVFRAAPIGVGVVVDRILKQVNKRMCEMTGYSNEELVGQKARMLYMCDDDYEYVGREKYRQICDLGTGTVETRWKCKAGHIIDVLLSSTPIDMSGPSREVVFTALDITERKQAEKELDKHREQLELLVDVRTRKLKEAQSELIRGERLATLGRLTATVSHEIRNPLGTIQMAIFSIGDSLERNELHRVKRSLELAERSISRCVNIIEDLTNYTRVKKLNITKTSLDDWLKTILDEEVILEDICCEFELASGIYAQIDQEKLRQVMINLITNAVHALLAKKPNDKILQISTHLFDDEYEIRVRDNGIGMSDETREKVFEPLFSTKGFGVGLGMVIAKGIVEQHHGKISIESMEGKGTTVTLRLPIRPPEGEVQ